MDLDHRCLNSLKALRKEARARRGSASLCVGSHQWDMLSQGLVFLGQRDTVLIVESGSGTCSDGQLN